MSKLYYGVAYYDEYINEERLQKDIEMMLAANINVVRIAESTWSTLEPQESIFNFYHIDRVLDAMHEAGIDVIIGTPTYAVPAWLAKKHPDVMITDPDGHQIYGRRQIMDITCPNFLYHAEKVIRVLIEHVCDHPAVIGYQVDNETKHYDNVGPFIQKSFTEYLQQKFPDLNTMNEVFGLNYWSNRIDNWDDMPPIDGTINASLGNEFARFRRGKVAEYLAWQADIIREYSKEEQFVTQNFDYEWRGYSFGLQPSVDHFEASKAMDIVSVDIYHPGQSYLTGREIAFGGDVARSTKDGQNYFIMETQAQGFPKWTPYPGQLKQQAFSHIASGAQMVAYWHWHSIHNSYETYWKGLISHDFKENPTYCEAKTVGSDFVKLSKELDTLRTHNDVAFYVSNDAMEAMNWFRPDTPQPGLNERKTYIYNDVLRQYYDALYDNNVSVDFINRLDPDNCKYKVLFVPSLYSATDEELKNINRYVENGGRVIVGFKAGFSDENVQVRTEQQPAILHKSCNVTYNQFTIPDNVSLKSCDKDLICNDASVDVWMELLKPLSSETQVLLTYDHPQWNQYAAATVSDYGSGKAMYVGCLPSKDVIYQLFSLISKDLALESVRSELKFPLIVRESINTTGQKVRFVFNYSEEIQTFDAEKDFYDALNANQYCKGDKISVDEWGTMVLVH